MIICPHCGTKIEKPAVLMKLSEAQPFLGVCYVTVWKMARRGDLPVVEIGNRLFILRKAFMKMVEGHEARE